MCPCLGKIQARLDFSQLKESNGAANSKGWINKNDLYVTIECVVCFCQLYFN